MTTLKTAHQRLRAICRRLPGAIETTTFGHPTFQAGPKKTFVVLDDHERRDELCVVFKVAPSEQAGLVRRAGFFASKFGGKKGWTSLTLGPDVDWSELAELVTTSYRSYATKRMLAELAGSSG